MAGGLDGAVFYPPASPGPIKKIRQHSLPGLLITAIYRVPIRMGAVSAASSRWGHVKLHVLS